MENQNLYPYERGVVTFETFSIDVTYLRDGDMIQIVSFYHKDREGLNEMFELKRHKHKKKTITALLASYIKRGMFTPILTHTDIYHDAIFSMIQIANTTDYIIKIHDLKGTLTRRILINKKRTIRRIIKRLK